METKVIKINWKNSKSIFTYLHIIYFIFLIITYVNHASLGELKRDAMLFIIGTIILCVLSMVEIKPVRKFLVKYSIWLNSFLLIIAPILSFVMVEIMVNNINKQMFQNYSIYNIVWYGVIYYFIYAAIRNCKYTIIIGNLVIYIMSMVNYFVYSFRGNPILPSDLLVWKTGMSVAFNYEITFTKGFLYASLIMFLLNVLGIKAEIKKKETKKFTKKSSYNRLIGLITYFCFAGIVLALFFRTDLIKSKIRVIDYFAPKYTYSSYGTSFGFIANVASLQTKAPEGYSLDRVEEAFQSMLKGEGTSEGSNSNQTNPLEPNKNTDSLPNIIAIMSEAYSDLSLIGDYKTNIDYLPYTRNITEDTIKGNLYVSVFGGATSDTEYEFLTGNSMAVMPSNSVPYQQFVTKKTDSLPSLLKEYGYYNVAIHPYKKSGYKRDLVYPLLGFDEFLSEDDFVNPEYIRSYIRDKESFKKIIEMYETKGKDNPVFIFNVTMQNHGGYGNSTIFHVGDNVRLNRLGSGKIEQYLSLLRESDKSFQILTDYFSKQDEPTLILIFGDHQPVAFSDIHKELEEQNTLNDLDLLQKKYVVPFVIWANYDIDETQIDKISSNYLSSYLLQVADIKGTKYNQYLMELYKKIPVVNPYFYIDSNNNSYRLNEKSDEASIVYDYQCIGYNNALDKKNRIDEFFQLKE